MSPARGFVKTLADFGIGQLFGGGARHALFEPFAAKVGWGYAPSLEGAVARLNSVDDPIICDQDFAAGIAAFLICTQVATTPAPYGWHDGATGDKKAVDPTASAGSCSPLLSRYFGRRYFVGFGRRGSPKSEQLQCLERRRETELGAETANFAKALWL